MLDETRDRYSNEQTINSSLGWTWLRWVVLGSISERFVSSSVLDSNLRFDDITEPDLSWFSNPGEPWCPSFKVHGCLGFYSYGFFGCRECSEPQRRIVVQRLIWVVNQSFFLVTIMISVYCFSCFRSWKTTRLRSFYRLGLVFSFHSESADHLLKLYPIIWFDRLNFFRIQRNIQQKASKWAILPDL